MTLLSQCRDVASDSTEGRGSFTGAEAPRDLLLHFHHSQVSLRKVIVKRHRKVSHESQHLLSVLIQPVQQVLGFALLLSSTLPCGQRLGRFLCLKPCFQDGL